MAERRIGRPRKRRSGQAMVEYALMFAGVIAPFTFGTLGRNSIRGPGINNWDLSITKTTTISEHKSVEFRAEFFNAMNHVQFLNPDTAGFSPTFGQITSDRGPRIIQFGLKFYY